MKRSPDNQINASFIDISRVTCGRLSNAQPVPLQAPQQRPIMDLYQVKQTAFRRDIKDNRYKSIFINSWLVRQRNRSWRKGLGKNPQKSELIHWWQCLLSGATEPWPHGLRETLAYTSSRTMSRPRVVCWHGLRQNSQKTECVLRHPPIGSWTKNCRFKRHPTRTGLKQMISRYWRVFIGRCFITPLLMPSLPGVVHFEESIAWFNSSMFRGLLMTLSLLELIKNSLFFSLGFNVDKGRAVICCAAYFRKTICKSFSFIFISNGIDAVMF